MATPFPFVAGAVLTAANLNAITELVTNTQTNDYTLAATDAGDRVIANKATAIVFTVPNSVFTASQIVRIHNIGAGTLTISAGAGLTLNGADVLTLAQYQGGELFFTSASSAIFFPTAKTVSASGLVFLTGATFTSVSSVSLPTNTFTATYRNYKLIIDFTGSSANVTITGRFRASGTDNSGSNYFGVVQVLDTVGNSGNLFSSASTSFTMLRNASSGDNGLRAFASLDIITPQIAITSRIGGVVGLTNSAFVGDNHGTLVGQHNTATQFDSFSFIASTGTFSGVYRVYGYSES